MDKELGFLIGAIEDGCIYHTKKNEYIIEIDQKNLQWLEYIQKVLRCLNKKSSIRKIKGKYFRLTCYSKDLYEIISEYKKNHRKILRKGRTFQKSFVQGFYDAEGSVHRKRYQISIFSKKRDSLYIVRTILKDSGIKTGKINLSKGVYNLPIYGKENIMKFKQKIDLRHKEKLKKLNALVERPTLLRPLKPSRGG